MARRPSHPNKEVEKSLQQAEAQGWRIEVGGSHAWGNGKCTQRMMHRSDDDGLPFYLEVPACGA
jgi:hypothetical protein